MFRFPKELEGHYCTILVSGLAAFEVKIEKVEDEEVIVKHVDGEEVHIRQDAIMVYWPDKARTMKARIKSDRMKEIHARKKNED